MAKRLLMTGAMMLAAGGALAADRRMAPAPELSYRLTEGQNLNAFVREGPVAAHLLLRNGADPRILVAFPAGNSGVALWFDRVGAPVSWTLESGPAPITVRDDKGRPLHGIRAVARVSAPRLTVKQALLTNIRYIRDYQAIAKFPRDVATGAKTDADRIDWARDRIDGAPGYVLSIRVLDGTVDGDRITAGPGGIRLEISAATGETPLTGLTERELLNARAAPDPAARNALRFLSYREKFLAGSWRFNTYFGRDTLMSVRLLMPALQPAAIEAGLGAVLARLSPGGEVAHEEGIGEFSIQEHRQASERGNDAPELDYGMVDDDYMLGPVAADYLLGPGRARAAAWLATPLASDAQPGRIATVGATLVRNLRFVVDQAAPFAARPGVATLVAIKPGRLTGEWRDSNDGLGGGIYAYDVNATLVPAALEATQRLIAAGLLDRYLTAGDRATLGAAAGVARVWRARAAPLFGVTVPAGEAAAAIRRYAAASGVPAAPALAALGTGPLAFHALSLERDGRPVRILNSDEGFDLLFGQPSPADLETYVGALMRPFPAGLMTDVGLLVANPVLASRDEQARFTPAAYHGTVVWSWQQALFAAGLERQLARRDLPASTRAVLTAAQARLWRAIEATRATRSSELWSWAYEGGRYRVVPFGAGKEDVDESNAAQLWSTVYLAVRAPKHVPSPRP